MVGRVHLNERRNVKLFVAGLPDHRAAGGGWHDIGVAFAVGITDLIQHGGQRATGIMTILDAQRIEDVAQNAGKTKQLNFATCQANLGAV